MHIRQSRGPQRPTIGQDVKAQLAEMQEQLNNIESMIAGSQFFAQAVATSEYRRDLKHMADFTALNAKVAKIADLATAVKTAYDGAIVERDAFKAERDALLAADSTDQAAVDAAEASLAAAEAVIASLTAVAEGTPVELPPDTGSTGGVPSGSTGGVTDPAPTF